MPSSSEVISQDEESQGNLAARLRDFEAFRQKVIASDFERLRDRQRQLREDIAEYNVLQTNVAKLVADKQTQLETRVDIGCGVTCAALVPDTRRLHVAVGLGFHVEVELEEVAPLVERCKAHLQAQLAEVDTKLKDVGAVAEAFDTSIRLLRDGEQGAGSA